MTTINDIPYRHTTPRNMRSNMPRYALRNHCCEMLMAGTITEEEILIVARLLSRWTKTAVIHDSSFISMPRILLNMIWSTTPPTPNECIVHGHLPRETRSNIFYQKYDEYEYCLKGRWAFTELTIALETIIQLIDSITYR